MSEEKKNAIVPVTETFLALKDTTTLTEVVEANMSGRSARWTDLERIKIPSGGAPVYMIEDALDGISTCQDFEAVMVWYNDSRTWWAESIEDGGAGNPPACTSEDLHYGDGYNTRPDELGRHECRICPNNRFGAAPIDTDNWCKESRQMFLMRLEKEDSFFPSVLVAPPTSLKPIQKYMMAITSRAIPFYGAVHKFSLTPEKNAQGIDYASIKIGFVRRLEPSEVDAVKNYASAMKPTFGDLPDSDLEM